MAYLSDNNKQTQDQGTPQGSQSGGQIAPMASSGGGFIGSSGSSGGSPTSTTGAGGMGGWTNIQSYLNANQGNTSSSDALNKQVGGAFQQDQKNLDQQASDTKSKGQAASNFGMSTDQASQLISDAGNKYQYGIPSQSDAYNQDINQVRTAQQSGYGGPRSGDFNYALSGNSYKYGSDLGNDQGFSGLMNNIYNTAAGGQMGSGALALQSQIDAQNPALSTARHNLLNQYSGLQQNVQNTTKDVNNALGSDESQFNAGKSSFTNWLKSQMGTDQGKIDAAVKAWNDAETANAAPNPSQYPAWNYQYQPGGTATESNVGGVDQARNDFNSIQDILGQGGNIAYTPTSLTHGSYVKKPNGPYSGGGGGNIASSGPKYFTN